MTQVTVKKILSWTGSVRDYCLPNKEQTVSDYQYNHREGKKREKRNPLNQLARDQGGTQVKVKKPSAKKKNPSSGAHLPGDSVVRRQRP